VSIISDPKIRKFADSFIMPKNIFHTLDLDLDPKYLGLIRSDD